MMKLMIVLASLLTLFGCQSPQNGFEGDTITCFSLSEGGGMNRLAGFRYEIKETEEGKVHFHFNEGYPDEKEFDLEDHSVFDSLQQIVLKHKMYRYKGNYEPRFEITDGQSWRLYVQYASKKTISAGGYMAGPDGYRMAFEEIIRCLQPWKDIPVPVNEVVSFVYDYGKEHYAIERKDSHALLTYDNDETGEHQVYEKEMELLEDLRVTFNVERLKMNNTRGTLDEGCTPWMYEITYSNGDHYRYESYDGDFKCGYTCILQGFLSKWMTVEDGSRD